MGIWQQLRLDMPISLNLGSYTRKSTCHGKIPELCWINYKNVNIRIKIQIFNLHWLMQNISFVNVSEKPFGLHRHKKA